MKLKMIKSILTTFICFSCLVGCGSNQSEISTVNTTVSESSVENVTSAETDTTELKKLVGQCNNDITNETIYLGNMATYEKNYMDSLTSLGGNIDSSKVSDNAYSWIKEKAQVNKDTIEQNYLNIQNEYKAILALSISGSEADAIIQNLNELYNNFNALYLLVDSPSGTPEIFYENAVAYVQNIQNYSSILTTLTTD